MIGQAPSYPPELVGGVENDYGALYGGWLVDDIRAAIVKRLNNRINHLRKTKRLMNFQDPLLDVHIARLVRLRDRTSTLGHRELGPLREDI